MSATPAELAAITAAWRDGNPLALATLVAVEGSSYRRPGARLLINADSSTVGNLTGGCLDREIVEAAATVHRTGTARVVEYDLRGDEEAVLGWGMGCNGLLRVLVEPATPSSSMLQLLDQSVRLRKKIRITTVVAGPQTGLRCWQVDGEAPGRTLPGATPSSLDHVFTETLLPRPRVVICGAGDDVPPVVRAATGLGWDVVVVDHRRLLLDPARFPAGTTLLRTVPDLDVHSYVLVMTHNFLRDCEYIAAALATPAPYIGVLGPNRRLRRMQQYLASYGTTPRQVETDRLRGPAGLDLGGQGPDEIAIEIVAELLAATRRPVQPPVTAVDTSPNGEPSCAEPSCAEPSCAELSSLCP
ncbi:XdhC family protein [Kribbella sp. CA-253562]|uniref:XdhC family protein n=1 Tax=Kribbella sp. CA-253562 TaxID=3239942 RepID=UPI003D8DF150